MMKRMNILLALALSSATAHASATPPATQLPVAELAGWEDLSADDGITVWRREVEGSPLIAFRGEATLDAPIAKVAQVLSDTSRKTEWVHQAAEARDLNLISDLERVEYNHTKTPIVLSDRDFVFHAKTTVDKAARKVTIVFKSTEHPSAPDSGDKVRGKLMESRYILTALEPNKTRILVEIHADPMGSVAKWIVNLFQKKWPRNTLEGIQKQVAKVDVIEHPRVKEFFADAFKK